MFHLNTYGEFSFYFCSLPANIASVGLAARFVVPRQAISAASSALLSAQRPCLR
jgi:hypothetical protein